MDSLVKLAVICFPVEKGGLGIWSFGNLVEALKLKLWRQFKMQRSL